MYSTRYSLDIEAFELQKLYMASYYVLSYQAMCKCFGQLAWPHRTVTYAVKFNLICLSFKFHF